MRRGNGVPLADAGDANGESETGFCSGQHPLTIVLSLVVRESAADTHGRGLPAILKCPLSPSERRGGRRFVCGHQPFQIKIPGTRASRRFQSGQILSRPVLSRRGRGGVARDGWWNERDGLMNAEIFGKRAISVASCNRGKCPGNAKRSTTCSHRWLPIS
jgi:hypothetical protein